jgi:hypothetical protein
MNFARNLSAGHYADFSKLQTGYGGLASSRNKTQMDSGFH